MPVTRAALLTSTLATALFLAGCAAKQRPEPWTPESLPKEKFSLKIAPMADFNHRTREQILELRSQNIQAEPRLAGVVPADYQVATRGIARNINFGGPWVGLEGPIFASPAGDLSHHLTKGPSMVSVPWSNPFLLMVTEYDHRFDYPEDMRAVFDSEGKPPHSPRLDQDILPVSAEFDGPGRRLTVTYRWLSTPITTAGEVRPYLALLPVNAYDLGLNYYAVSRSGSQGILCQNRADQKPWFDSTHPSHSFFSHDVSEDWGGADVNDVYFGVRSYPTLSVERLPARVEVSFWRERPGTAQVVPPDFSETIVIQGLGISGEPEEVDLRPHP